MKIIGISGIARSGKDTIADALLAEISNTFPNLIVEKKSLAFFLKEEMKSFIAEKFEKDVHLLDGEDKEMLRPLLVAYGFAKRSQTKGKYFTDLLSKELLNEPNKVYIVSDIRYADNEADELFWLRENKGLLIHISRFNSSKDGEKVFLSPPNEDERRNDPILEKAADFNISWKTAKTPEELAKMSKFYCESFVMSNINFFLNGTK